MTSMNNDDLPVISIIMPAYNSENCIKNALDSIKNQSYPAEKVEILVVDGGSSDSTREIAKEYGARIINNPHRLPEFAKEIGFAEANGRYGVFLDTDEMFQSDESLIRRVNFFNKNENVKVITSTGGPAPKSSPGATRYACNIGDPFSTFIYHFYNGSDYMATAVKQFKYNSLPDGVIFDYSSSKYLPLYDGLGQMFDIRYVREIAKQSQIKNITTDMFCNIVGSTLCSGMLYDDYIVHDQQMHGRKYLSKIVWRIKNNLFESDCVGYSSRSVKQKHLNVRKYLFIPYSLTVIPVLFMAVYLTFRHKDIYMFMHFFYTEATFLMICWFVILKVLGINVKRETSYAK